MLAQRLCTSAGSSFICNNQNLRLGGIKTWATLGRCMKEIWHVHIRQLLNTMMHELLIHYKWILNWPYCGKEAKWHREYYTVWICLCMALGNLPSSTITESRSVQGWGGWGRLEKGTMKRWEKGLEGVGHVYRLMGIDTCPKSLVTDFKHVQFVTC